MDGIAGGGGGGGMLFVLLLEGESCDEGPAAVVVDDVGVDGCCWLLGGGCPFLPLTM